MSQPKTFYIFHGEDDIAITEAVDKLRAGMGEFGEMNTSEFEGESVTVPELLNAVSSYPFLSDKRLVIVKGLAAHVSRKGAGETGKRAIEQLITEGPTLPEHARLILVERGALSEKDKLLNAVGSMPNGFVRLFNTPSDLAGWLTKRAAVYQAEIEPRAAAALAELVGPDLRRLDNELVKLADYALPRTLITEDDVAAITPYVPEANIFQMVDAMASGDGRTALRLLHRLLQDKNNTVFSVYGMITRQFRLLILAREQLDRGGGNLASALGVHPRAAEGFARQARAFNITDLEGIHRRLLDYDVAMKTGAMEPELAVDLLITGLTAG
ncbi:MAG: DNA polymerase III subunit delta [Anaerolineae bacterium]|jgi:DNA polymerase-3 subunit delta|nr:DNA polymerase III subunit delta [Anaerolineae bacterium]